MMNWIRRIVVSVGIWVPVLIAVFVVVLAIALMFLFHLYRVSGLRWSEAAANWGQILTLDNILLGLLILVIAAGFANISGRR